MAKKETKQLPQSKQMVVKRSQIKLNPYNPKRHPEAAIKEQLRNFKKVGYLGGIILNSVTGNLVSGHKRLQAQDLFFGNKPDSPVDYDVRVEVVSFDEKTELEQLIYLDAKSTNTKQSYDLLAEILPKIDPKEAGLDTIELDLIAAESPEIEAGADFTKDFEKAEKPYEDRKQAVKDMKAKIKANVQNEQGASYVTLSFDNYENKAQFMSALGYDTDAVIIKGEAFYDRLNEMNG